jgi:hypothetical protein
MPHRRHVGERSGVENVVRNAALYASARTDRLGQACYTLGINGIAQTTAAL